MVYNELLAERGTSSMLIHEERKKIVAVDRHGHSHTGQYRVYCRIGNDFGEI